MRETDWLVKRWQQSVEEGSGVETIRMTRGWAQPSAGTRKWENKFCERKKRASINKYK